MYRYDKGCYVTVLWNRYSRRLCTYEHTIIPSSLLCTGIFSVFFTEATASICLEEVTRYIDVRLSSITSDNYPRARIYNLVLYGNGIGQTNYIRYQLKYHGSTQKYMLDFANFKTLNTITITLLPGRGR